MVCQVLKEENEKIIYIEGKPIKLVEVTSKKSSGLKHVYDLEVKDNHNYYANGVNVHNCGYHKLLDSYALHYKEEVYRFKDTFLIYRHRGLVVYPSGPNMKTLRGRTRFMCLTGNTLVNTSNGLIPIKKDISGLTTKVGNSTRKIVKHMVMGKKEVFKLTLKNGLSITATPDHRVRVLGKDHTLKWKQLGSLLHSDNVVCSLGGDFPKSLPLSFIKPEKQERLYYKVLEYISSVTSFSLEDLFSNISGFSSKNAVTAQTSKLVRFGLVSKQKFEPRGNSVYTVIASKSKIRREKTLFKEKIGNGKINKIRDLLTFPSVMTVELAHLLGYLAADGNYALWGKTTEISFTSTSLYKVEHFEHCFLSVFGYKPRRSSWVLPSKQIAYSNVFCYGVIKEFLIYLGVTPAWSYTKTVPWVIQQSPRDCVVAYLSSAISCDGSIKGRGCTYSSKSKKLLAGFQQLFFRLGYPCYISGEAVRLKPHAKNLWLLEYIGLGKRDEHHINKPTTIKNSSAYSEYRIPGFSIEADRTTNYIHTLPELNRDCTKHLIPRIDHLLNKNLIFVKVKKIKSLGIKKIYDIQVDSKDHSFTANSIVVHNSFIDELGWFDNSAEKNKVKDNANEVYIALERSLLTVRAAANRLLRQGYDNIPTAFFFNVSSPSSARDKIMELINKAKISKKIFAMHRATWEMNPNVTREDLEDEFRKDPVAADRDYGANPPLANSPLISNIEMVDQCIGDFKNRVDSIKFKQRKNIRGEATRYAILTPRTIIQPSVLTIDAGFTANSFACIVAHLDRTTKYANFTTFVEIQPRIGVPLNYTLIYNHVLVPLIKEQNVVMVRADRWNSIKLLSDMQEQFKHLDTGQYSLKYEDITLFKDYIIDKEVVFPKYEWKNTTEILNFNYADYPKCMAEAPVSHFVLQAVTVQDTGRAVNKGTGLTDDLFRAASLAFTTLIDEKNEKLFLGANKVGTAKALGSVATKGGGSGGGGSMISSTSSGKALGMLGGR